MNKMQCDNDKIEYIQDKTQAFSMAKTILSLKPRQVKTSAKLNQRYQLPLK
jgi:hypothetical protein